MTRDETIKILMVIQAAYPNYKPQDKTVAVNVWAEMLSAIPYERVSAGVEAYLHRDTSGFAPSVGDVRERVRDIFAKEDELNETAAWSLVMKAIRRSGYYSEEEFEKLPPVVRRAVASPKQLREWATLEDVDGKAMTVIQANFQRTFRMEQKREQERNKLSPDILKLMNPIITPRIEDKPGKLSIEAQREIAEANAIPAPKGLMNEAKRRLKVNNE